MPFVDVPFGRLNTPREGRVSLSMSPRQGLTVAFQKADADKLRLPDNKWGLQVGTGEHDGLVRILRILNDGIGARTRVVKAGSHVLAFGQLSADLAHISAKRVYVDFSIINDNTIEFKLPEPQDSGSVRIDPSAKTVMSVKGPAAPVKKNATRPDVVEKNGIVVDYRVNSITYKAKTVLLDEGHAVFLSIITPGSPEPIGYEFILRKMNLALAVDQRESFIKNIARECSRTIREIGLEVFIVPVGIGLRPR